MNCVVSRSRSGKRGSESDSVNVIRIRRHSHVIYFFSLPCTYKTHSDPIVLTGTRASFRCRQKFVSFLRIHFPSLLFLLHGLMLSWFFFATCFVRTFTFHPNVGEHPGTLHMSFIYIKWKSND